MKTFRTVFSTVLAAAFIFTGCTGSSNSASGDGDGEKYAQNSVNNTIPADLDASKATDFYSTMPYLSERGILQVDFAAVDPGHTMIEFGTYFPDDDGQDSALTVLDPRKIENVYNVVAAAEPDLLFSVVFQDDGLYFVNQEMSNQEILQQIKNGFPDALYSMKAGDNRKLGQE